MELAFFQKELIIWAIAMAVGIPLMIVLLGELIERLEFRGNPLAAGLRDVRHVVIPVLAVLLILQQLSGMSSETGWVRVVETLFWMTAIYTGLKLLSNLNQMTQINPASWVANVPGILFALARAVLVCFILVRVFSGIWGIDLSNIATALGIGSLAIALALQDTLGNLVSGFLLLADRPFKVGDWIFYHDKWLQVEDINWRAVRLRGKDNTLTAVPSGLLGKQAVQNAGPDDGEYRMVLLIRFHNEGPPNVVKDMLTEILLSTEGVLRRPAPQVKTMAYGDFVIEYEMRFFIHFSDFFDMPDRINTKIFYAAKRHHLTPSAIQLFHFDRSKISPEDGLGQMAENLRAIPLFSTSDADTLGWLGSNATTRYYGAGEQVVRIGEPDLGFYIIQNGRVKMSVRDKSGMEQEIDRLSPGSFFGEMALLRDEPSPVSIMALDDLQVLIINHQTMRQFINTHPMLTLELDAFIQKRGKAVRVAMGVEDE